MVLENLLELWHGKELLLRECHAHPPHLLHEVLEGRVRWRKDGPWSLVVGLLVAGSRQSLGHPRVLSDLDAASLLEEVVEQAGGVEGFRKGGQDRSGSAEGDKGGGGQFFRISARAAMAAEGREGCAPDARLEVLVLHEGDEAVVHAVDRHAGLGLGPRHDVDRVPRLVSELELAVKVQGEPEAAGIEGGAEAVAVEGLEGELLVGREGGPVRAPLDGGGLHGGGVAAEVEAVEGPLALVDDGPPGEVDGLRADVLDDDGLALPGRGRGEDLHELNFGRGRVRREDRRDDRENESGALGLHRFELLWACVAMRCDAMRSLSFSLCWVAGVRIGKWLERTSRVTRNAPAPSRRSKQQHPHSRNFPGGGRYLRFLRETLVFTGEFQITCLTQDFYSLMVGRVANAT